MPYTQDVPHIPEKGEEDKPLYRTFGDRPRRHKVKSSAKFNYDYVEVAARLVASGHTEKDLEYVLGLGKGLINTWKKRYPQFRTACLAGKEIAVRVLTAQMLRAASGYEYEKKIVTYKTITDEDGKEVSIKTGEKTITDFQKGEPTLAMFALCNMAPENWKMVSHKKIQETKIALNLDGSTDAEIIRKFAGRLFEEYSGESSRKSIVSSEVVQDTRRRGVQEGISPDVPCQTPDSVQEPVLDVQSKNEARLS